MHITDLLIAEHHLLRVMMRELDASIRARMPAAHLRAQASMVASVFNDHARIEDEVLAPRLRHLSGDAMYFAGNMQVMDDVIALLFGEAAHNNDAPGALSEAIRLAAAQFDQEEQEIFPLAEDAMSDRTLTALTRVAMHALPGHQGALIAARA